MTKHDKDLLKIANEELFYCFDRKRADLDAHRSDDEDFMELSIWDIKRALEKAYELGRRDAQR